MDSMPHAAHPDLVTDVHDRVHAVDAILADITDVQQSWIVAFQLKEGTIRLNGADDSLNHLSNLQADDRASTREILTDGICAASALELWNCFCQRAKLTCRRQAVGHDKSTTLCLVGSPETSINVLCSCLGLHQQLSKKL